MLTIQFATHADEQRHDANEGSASVICRTDDGGGQTIVARAVLGQNAYVLCGSTHHDPQLMKAFGCDSYIRIENPMAFGQAARRGSNSEIAPRVAKTTEVAHGVEVRGRLGGSRTASGRWYLAAALRNCLMIGAREPPCDGTAPPDGRQG